MAILLDTDFLENPDYDIALTKQAECELHKLIDTVEKDVLQELFGCELYDLFIADLDAGFSQVPQSQIYLDIFEPFCKDDSGFCGILRSRGIKDMLMAFVYFEWHRYNHNKSVSGGVVRMESENSNQLSPDAFGIYDKYNRGVETYTAIQWCICDNTTDYPTFNGQRKHFNSAI